MKPVDKMSLGELAAFVCSHLRAHGIEAVLSGGGCVSIYTSNRYQSYDLDFIENMPTSRQRIKEVLLVIGFFEKDRIFEHPQSNFFLDFPAGPLAVGSEPVMETVEMTFPTGKLTLLSPTDCVKDRLAAYYHWDDLQSLEQALLVVEAKEVDIEEIRRWSAVENKSAEFDGIRDMLLEAAGENENSN